jgi:ribosomal protein L37AE/L43A
MKEIDMHYCPFCGSEQIEKLEDGFYECLDCDEEFHEDNEY